MLNFVLGLTIVSIIFVGLVTLTGGLSPSFCEGEKRLQFTYAMAPSTQIMRRGSQTAGFSSKQ